jgi:hypothetical protein
MTFSARRSGGLIARQVVKQEGASSATKLKWSVYTYRLDVNLTALAFRSWPAPEVHPFITNDWNRGKTEIAGAPYLPFILETFGPRCWTSLTGWKRKSKFRIKIPRILAR